MKFLKEYGPEEQELLRNVVCVGEKDGFIDYYLRVCDTRKVDPFSGLLYLTVRETKRGSGIYKPTVGASIDGSRAIAARHGDYAGSDEPEYDTDTEPKPKWCRVTVYKMVEGERCAFTAKCRFDEFKVAGPGSFQWDGKPYHMLAKCTEMQALRKAWPEALAESFPGETEEAPEQAPQKIDEALGKAVAVGGDRWANALRAFEAFSLDEKALFAKLGKSTGITADDYTKLESWYKELERGEQTA